jgi:uncharacterized coiled-coil protein SlyX
MSKEFQKTDDDDLDAFLNRRDKSKTQDATDTKTVKKDIGAKTPPKEPGKPAPAPVKAELTDDENDEQIKVARTSRAAAEAYQDVAILRKKAHDHSHTAAKLYHKYKLNEAKTQRCSSRAVSLREKSDERRDKAREYQTSYKEYESELDGAAQEKTDLSPESLRTKMASLERKIAKQEEHAKKLEKKAADLTQKGAKFRSRAARFLEKSRLHESEARTYSKRADNLEKANS